MVTLVLSFVHMMNAGHERPQENCVCKTQVCLRPLHGRVTSESNHLLLPSCGDMWKVRACRMYSMGEICHLLWLIHRGCECTFALCCNERGGKKPATRLIRCCGKLLMRCCEVERSGATPVIITVSGPRSRAGHMQSTVEFWGLLLPTVLRWSNAELKVCLEGGRKSVTQRFNGQCSGELFISPEKDVKQVRIL